MVWAPCLEWSDGVGSVSGATALSNEFPSPCFDAPVVKV